VQDPSPSDVRTPLARLAGDEAELERRLEAARREAGERVTAARGEAERIAAGARAELEAELARYRAESEALVAAERERSDGEARAAASELARRAERNGARALARLLEIVRGEGDP
jgi:F0F1-type ATP synthase membrane subunit b/b'